MAGRTIEQPAGRAGGSLALAGGPPPSRHGCQAPQALSTGTRWGGPARARRAWWPRRCGCRPCLRQRVRVLGQRPESSVWCGCPASRVPVHAAAVRCPVRASERPGVRCPAWVSGVRGFPRPLCPTGRLWGGGGADSRMAGMAGVGVVAGPVHGQFVGCPGRNLAVEAGVGRAGPAEASTWTSPSSWELVGVVAGSTVWATGMGWMGAGIARWWRAGVRSEAATTLRGHRVRLRAGSPGRCEAPGLGCDLRVRPWCGRRMR